MAYNYLDSSILGDILKDSEDYMKPFYDPLAELERSTRGKPGKIPEGKPRITEGTLAGQRRETPKQIIQQLPTGKVVYKPDATLGELMGGTLTDLILPYANSGGTPYAKSKNAIKDTFSTGASFAFPFFNRTGDHFHADFRRVYCRDVYFEKGKVSEFDSNFMFMIGWYTESDLKAIIYWQQQLEKSAKERGEKYKGRWNLKFVQELLDKGPQKKDDANKSPEDKLAGDIAGYFKVAHAMQTGIGGQFYSFAPSIEKTVQEWQNPDPRGVIPLHGLIPEEDYANPLGEALGAISVGKQNLLDFDLQMYQYGQGMSYSPTMKKWGETPLHKIKIIPDHVIEMNGNKQTDDIEVVNIQNQAIANFGQNQGLLQAQILRELGRPATNSVGADSGVNGFGRTPSAIKSNDIKTGVSDADLRKSYELWFGRVCETMLNLHYAESQGEKLLEFEPETLKRLKLEGEPKMNYSQEFARIKFTVDASSSQAADNERETEKFLGILDTLGKQGGIREDKKMLILNQIIKNSGVDDPEKMLFDDNEIAQAQERALAQQAAAHATAMAQATMAIQQAQAGPQQTPTSAPTGPSPEELALKGQEQQRKDAELQLKADKQEHDKRIQMADLFLRTDKQAGDQARGNAGHAVTAHPTPKPQPAGAAR